MLTSAPLPHLATNVSPELISPPYCKPRITIFNMDLWYETHSTSTDNERGIASGHLNPPLSETGRAQAIELGRRHAARRFQAIYTSDLLRAVSTADLAFAGSSIPLLPDPRLRECDYGLWSGCSTRQMDDARVNFVDQPFPGGECFRDVARRIKQVLDEIAGQDGPVLIIAHRAPWYALEHLLNARDLAEVVASPWRWQPGWLYNL